MSPSLIRLCLLASFIAMVFGSVIDPVARRQVTRDRIVQRSATKAILAELSARNPTRARRQLSGASPVPAPGCAAGLSLLPGYAHYAGWDLPGRGPNRPTQPVDISQPGATTERECQEKCNVAVGAGGTTCVGLFWWPQNNIGSGNKFCSLKNSAYPYAPEDFTTGGAAATFGAATNMRGTCVYWRQFVPAAMDAVCCQT